MRPLRLEIAGFSAFREPIEVDVAKDDPAVRTGVLVQQRERR